MAYARKIPPVLVDEVLRQRAEGKRNRETRAWLKRAHGIDISERGLGRLFARIDAERAPIARAVTVQELTGKVTADLQGFDGIIRRAERDERAAEKGEAKLDDLERELTILATTDMKDFLAEDGSILPLEKMPKDKRRAISSIRVEQIEVSGSGDDGDFKKVVSARVISLKLWDKNIAAKQLVDVRERKVGRELALKARDQQARVREVRLEMAGAKPSAEGEKKRVVVLPPVRPVAEEPESQPLPN